MRWSRRFAIAAAIAASFPFLAATPSQADGWHRGHGHYHRGYRHAYRVPPPRVTFGLWWGPGWYGPPYYYPPYSPYYVAPPIVLQAPPAYIERPVPDAPQSFWYYCPSAQAYYPTAPTCDEPWVKVPASPE